MKLIQLINEMAIVYFSGNKEKMLTFITCVFVSEYYFRLVLLLTIFITAFSCVVVEVNGQYSKKRNY